MSNKELRDAILVRYRVCLKRRWYYIALLLIYVILGIGGQIAYLRDTEENPYVIVVGVFAIIGVVATSMLELTRHEKSQYLIPISYEERKRYYFIGVLVNFTIVLVIAILFIFGSFLVDRQCGIETVKLFGLWGVPFLELTSLQKINMFKGKKKKDNPKSVYISYAVGIVIGLMIVAIFPFLPFIMRTEWLLSLLTVGINLTALARVIYALIDIIRKNTDYENVKVKEMLALKKLM